MFLIFDACLQIDSQMYRRQKCSAPRRLVIINICKKATDTVWQSIQKFAAKLCFDSNNRSQNLKQPLNEFNFSLNYTTLNVISRLHCMKHFKTFNLFQMTMINHFTSSYWLLHQQSRGVYIDFLGYFQSPTSTDLLLDRLSFLTNIQRSTSAATTVTVPLMLRPSQIQQTRRAARPIWPHTYKTASMENQSLFFHVRNARAAIQIVYRQSQYCIQSLIYEYVIRLEYF